MTKLFLKHKTGQRQTRGVTLVELLIVISILSVVAAVLIPRLRMVNKDRNGREAARVVASAFAKAVNRAVNDGTSGLFIEPNANFQGSTSAHVAGETNDNVFFAGTRIYQMRKMPPYIGDDPASLAETGTVGNVAIPLPFEHDIAANPPRLIVRQYDQISFNGSSYRYLISSVPQQVGSDLEFNINAGSAPMPNLDAGVSFVIHRQPRRLESSVVELPAGYMIDLRYSYKRLSGVLAADGADISNYGTYLNQNANQGIALYFDASGGVERVLYRDMLQSNPRMLANITASPLDMPGAIGDPGPRVADNTLHWFVSHYQPNAFDAAGSYKPGSDPIMNPSNKWVTLDPVTGSVNVASNRVPTVANAGGDPDGDGNNGTLSDFIFEARSVARSRQSANQ